MITLVHVPASLGRRRVDRIELQRADAAVAQALEELRRRAERADAVVDQVHLHALALLLDQRISEAQADLVVFEDVGLHVDVVACRLDGCKHRAVCLRPVHEQPDPIAGQQRAVGHRLLEREVAVEDVRLVGSPFERLQDRAAARRGQRTPWAVQLRGRCCGLHVRHDLGQRAAGDKRHKTEGCEQP